MVQQSIINSLYVYLLQGLILGGAEFDVAMLLKSLVLDLCLWLLLGNCSIFALLLVKTGPLKCHVYKFQ